MSIIITVRVRLNCNKNISIYFLRGISSYGRALALHARGSGIDAHILQLLPITPTVIFKRILNHFEY
jgi:hypothetical protein